MEGAEEFLRLVETKSPKLREAFENHFHKDYIPISKVKELIEKKSFIASWQMDADHAKTIAFTGHGGIIKIEDLQNLIKGAEGKDE